MKLHWIIFLVTVFLSCSPKEDPEYRNKIAAHRLALNEEFSNPATSPLDSLERTSFKGLQFFPINEKYKVSATITLLTDQAVFELPHSHDRSKPYKNFARLKFELNGKDCELILMEPQMKKEGTDDYLLLPFTDETNGSQTYGGGRYIDCSKKEVLNSKEITIDFNMAYNPYCAYSSHYTCPIPPKENYLPFPVEAGVKY